MEQLSSVVTELLNRVNVTIQPEPGKPVDLYVVLKDLADQGKIPESLLLQIKNAMEQ